MYAYIKNGRVTEIINADNLEGLYAPAFVKKCVPCAGTVTTGMTWDGESFGPAAEPVRTADDVRTERDRRLAASDWTQIADAPLDDATRSAWAAYRQALRDVPGQDGFPFNVRWPNKPE